MLNKNKMWVSVGINKDLSIESYGTSSLRIERVSSRRHSH